MIFVTSRASSSRCVWAAIGTLRHSHGVRLVEVLDDDMRDVAVGEHLLGGDGHRIDVAAQRRRADDHARARRTRRGARARPARDRSAPPPCPPSARRRRRAPDRARARRWRRPRSAGPRSPGHAPASPPGDRRQVGVARVARAGAGRGGAAAPTASGRDGERPGGRDRQPVEAGHAAVLRGRPAQQRRDARHARTRARQCERRPRPVQPQHRGRGPGAGDRQPRGGSPPSRRRASCATALSVAQPAAAAERRRAQRDGDLLAPVAAHERRREGPRERQGRHVPGGVASSHGAAVTSGSVRRAMTIAEEELEQRVAELIDAGGARRPRAPRCTRSPRPTCTAIAPTARAPRRSTRRSPAPSSWSPRAAAGPQSCSAFNPTGYECAGSVVEATTDDLPYLVDSVGGGAAGSGASRCAACAPDHRHRARPRRRGC